METISGFLVLSKRQPGFGEGGDVLIPPAAIVAIEPHRLGSYVYVAGYRWDVAHPHTEIMQAVDAARRGRAGMSDEPWMGLLEAVDARRFATTRWREPIGGSPGGLRKGYSLSPEELAAWEAALDQNGIPGLRSTRQQSYRLALLGKGARREKRGPRGARRWGSLSFSVMPAIAAVIQFDEGRSSFDAAAARPAQDEELL
jgi:Protein of unknown function (DUF1153)